MNFTVVWLGVYFGCGVGAQGAFGSSSFFFFMLLFQCMFVWIGHFKESTVAK